MGIYDRDYSRDDQRGSWLANRSMVVNLILLNAAMYVADFLSDHRISNVLSLSSDMWRQPWHFYQLLTYGFMHDPDDLKHILFNMFFLWVFGNEIEQIYGRTEFLRFYLATIVLAGLVWMGFEAANGGQGILVGASGAIMGVMILYVLHFPRRLIYIWGILPLPVWALGVLYVLFDFVGMAQNSGNVAHVAHLSGVAFGFAYYRGGWNLGHLIPRRLSSANFKFKLKPPLRIHDPDADAPRDLNEQVDQILEKISREGESSLTKKERRTLEEASRRYQRRRN